ncbi:hypothetical protein [Brevundimonas denitrificans]|uniref:hypothetical protein n=1 Tax=Brevundimonas denitrificans TaxID=1443434 RepID=UPI00223AD54E|nr:hypothetical protein [Brevundimonas denitrificans]
MVTGMEDEAMRDGQVVVVVGYSDRCSADQPVFMRGDLAVVAAVGAEGDLTCHALTHDGRVARGRSDMLWPEEVLAVNNTPLVAAVLGGEP